MKQLIQQGYKAIVNRGLITNKTTKADFLNKLLEEVSEVLEADEMGQESELIDELSDVANVCFNAMLHLGYDPVEEYLKTVKKNESRIKIK